jgi:site-specific recombinase XerD
VRSFCFFVHASVCFFLASPRDILRTFPGGSLAVHTVCHPRAARIQWRGRRDERHTTAIHPQAARGGPAAGAARHALRGSSQGRGQVQADGRRLRLRRPPTLGDFTADSVRFFLAAEQDRPKFEGHTVTPARPEERIGGATLHQFVRSLKTFGAWLLREGYVATHPLAVVRLPKVEEKELVPLSEDEEQRLLAAYNDNDPSDCRAKAILMLLLDTGIRRAELASLRLMDVDLQDGIITVWGKGRKQRSVPFGFATEKVLRKYLEFFRPRPDNPRIDNLFLTPDGRPMTGHAIELLFRRIKRRTGIKRLHAHLLRHTYGIRSQELETPVPTHVLQAYLGHTSSQITERYTHAAQSDRLKRARWFSHVDQLGVQVRRSPRQTPRPGRGKPVR